MLNGFFIPVYLRNQDFDEEGKATGIAKVEKLRIYREALERKLPAGTVCIYLLSPDGHPVDTAPLNQPDATNPQRMTQKLTRVAAEFDTEKGDPIIPPRPQSRPRLTDEHSVALHVTARYLQRDGKELVRLNSESVLGTGRGGNWGDLPSEDWVVLSETESGKLLPAEKMELGTTWEIDASVASKILKRFFPPTENTNFEGNQIIEQSLQAELVSTANGTMRAKLSGHLKMKHAFYHKDDGNMVDARLLGYVDIDQATKRVRSFRLITESASYGANRKGQLF